MCLLYAASVHVLTFHFVLVCSIIIICVCDLFSVSHIIVFVLGHTCMFLCFIFNLCTVGSPQVWVFGGPLCRRGVFK